MWSRPQSRPDMDGVVHGQQGLQMNQIYHLPFSPQAWWLSYYRMESISIFKAFFSPSLPSAKFSYIELALILW